MSDAKRFSPEETRAAVASGEYILVCAYDSDKKFSTYHLEGAISLSEFKSRVDSLDKSSGIIFYCA